ncbi:hypothetical protein CC1G_05381 [Coprinopsis cinerea okayama7|uniref:Oxidoreductase n=1 Tax=Coprinopsis cinerea (strain Okayama-7 / 130 / ATCC MYA-4618 / FGSC 9003) TaxID=240176 RepID=A8NPW4_COPC7|nr:hypothetical protein CC1G_05381 [Coprinopsis cinerea okayama7\|eukprot:XP_001835419.2 hypothetical protein CC1G_05381 [Coprinopsis cinerea okayama7\
MPTSNGKFPVQSEFTDTNLQPRWIPTVGYAIQNALISFATLVVSFASLIVTCSVVFPLSFYRTLLARRTVTLIPPRESLKRGKVVLIVGASRGIGLEVLKQYCNEPETTVIAVSKTADVLESALGSLGDVPATLRSAALDLAGPSRSIVDIVNRLDQEYGPVSHLYAISGITNYTEDESPWDLDFNEEMIKVNVSGIVSLVMTMYERMKGRSYGKICIIGSTAGIYSPANMITYASTKSFLNTFATSLRVLAASSKVEVVTVEPGFIDSRITRKMREQGATPPEFTFKDARALAKKMKETVEVGGIGVLTWPFSQGLLFWGTRGLNPILEEAGKFLMMKARVSGKKIS